MRRPPREICRCVALPKDDSPYLLAFAALAASVFANSASAQTGGTMTLRQAVTLALQNSRDLKLARLQYTVAQNEAGVDRAAFRPNLYTGAGYVYTYGFPALPGGGPPSLIPARLHAGPFQSVAEGATEGGRRPR